MGAIAKAQTVRRQAIPKWALSIFGALGAATLAFAVWYSQWSFAYGLETRAQVDRNTERIESIREVLTDIRARADRMESKIDELIRTSRGE